MTVNDVACVVVHHNSLSTLGPTVDALVHAGLPRRNILVVDNSTDPAVSAEAADRFSALVVPNRGYAAAVNDGLRYLTEQGLALRFTLIATHESIASVSSIDNLRNALVDDRSIAAAGPTLIDSDSSTAEIWSLGGILSPRLKLPRHIRDKSELERGEARAFPVDREWLDGAFVLYRTDILSELALDEIYFLYFEETDLHQRIRLTGNRAVWVPRAHVSQQSSGIPPRLLGRNQFLFHSRFFGTNLGRCAVIYLTGRSITRKLVSGRGKWSDSAKIWEGWREGERIVASSQFATFDKHPDALARGAQGNVRPS